MQEGRCSGCGERSFDGHEITFLDLFSGIGAGRKGFEEACRQLGIEPRCVGFSEIDKHAITTYLRHYPGTPALGDIRDLAKSDAAPECDIVLAGFPCPAFSTAGKREGFDDARGQRFFDLTKVIEKATPKAFLLENVKGLQTHSGGKTLQTVLETLRGLGYIVAPPAIINSRDFGVPQNRPRIYFVGFRGNVEGFRFPEPTDSTKRLKDVLEAGPVHFRHYVTEQYLEGIRRHKARHEAKAHGFGFRIIDPATDVAAALVCGGMGRERNLIVDRGITTFPILPNRKTPISGECIRRLTPLECERLQGLPDNFTAGQPDGHRYRQISNAITVPAITAISRNLLESLTGSGRAASQPTNVSHGDGHIVRIGQAEAAAGASRCWPNALRFGDVCSGIGGIRLAIEAAGGQCVFSSEIDPKARLVYHANYGEWPSGDITKIQAEDVPDHDLLCAGFPCQPFSLSGKRLGFEDATRGTIFFDIVRIARAKRPAAILLENVKGLKSHDGGRTLATIVGALEEIGYRVTTPKVLNASLFGCPTARERVFIVALRSDLGIGNFKFPEPTNEIVCLDDVLLPDSETDRWVVRGRQVFIDEEAVARAEGKSALEPVRVGLVDNRDAQGYRVYSDQGHAITFCAHGGGIGAKTGLYWINGRVRRLDPRECLAVMGYPKSFVIPPSISPDQVRTLIGNSVAVVVVRRAYESIVAALAEVGHRSINVTSSSARLVSTKTDARTALDLFAGCGGFSQGFQEEGFEVVGACQWDPKIPAIARTYEANHPGTVMVDADITLPETKERICRLFENRHCDVIIGGPPCGPFSRSGKRDRGTPA